MENDLLITGGEDLVAQVTNLVQAAIEGDADANHTLDEIAQAAEQGDKQAAQIIQIAQELMTKSVKSSEASENTTSSMKQGGVAKKMRTVAQNPAEEPKVAEKKCGGTAKKIRKSACGSKVKKTENGDSITKTWKDSSFSIKYGEKGGKCPCALKRVGGKIVTVDTCTGMPIHKNGGSVTKFEDGGAPKNPFGFEGDGNIYYNNQTGEVRGTGKNRHAALNGWDFYMDKRGRNTLYAKGADGKIYASKSDWMNTLNPFSGSSNHDSWEEVTGDNLAIAQGFFNSNQQMKEDGGFWDSGKQGSGIVKLHQFAQVPASALAAAQASSATVPASSVRAAYNNGDMTDEEVLRRQQLMVDAGMNIRGGVDGKWGASSAANWAEYERTHPNTVAPTLDAEKKEEVVDPYTRSALGVYQDEDNNIDWTRSVDPEAYRNSVLNGVQNAYQADRDRLSTTWNGHMSLRETQDYWRKRRELFRNRKNAMKQARQQAQDYQLAYNDYTYGQIGKAPTVQPEGEAGAVPTSDKTFNPYFQSKAGRFANGGMLMRKGGKIVEVPVQYAELGTKLWNATKRFINPGNMADPGAMGGDPTNWSPIMNNEVPRDNVVRAGRIEVAPDRKPYTGDTMYDWMGRNGGEQYQAYGPDRQRLARQYGINDYTGTAAQNMQMWDRAKQDVDAGYQIGGPQMSDFKEEAPIAQASAPSVNDALANLNVSGYAPVDQDREAAIAAMAGKHISNRERRRYGAAYDAIKNGANPAQMTSRQLADIQRMGKVYRPQSNQEVAEAKNGTKIGYAQYLS